MSVLSSNLLWLAVLDGSSMITSIKGIMHFCSRSLQKMQGFLEVVGLLIG